MKLQPTHDRWTIMSVCTKWCFHSFVCFFLLGFPSRIHVVVKNNGWNSISRILFFQIEKSKKRKRLERADTKRFQTNDYLDLCCEVYQTTQSIDNAYSAGLLSSTQISVHKLLAQNFFLFNDLFIIFFYYLQRNIIQFKLSRLFGPRGHLSISKFHSCHWWVVSDRCFPWQPIITAWSRKFVKMTVLWPQPIRTAEARFLRFSSRNAIVDAGSTLWRNRSTKQLYKEFRIKKEEWVERVKADKNTGCVSLAIAFQRSSREANPRLELFLPFAVATYCNPHKALCRLLIFDLKNSAVNVAIIICKECPKNVLTADFHQIHVNCINLANAQRKRTEASIAAQPDFQPAVDIIQSLELCVSISIYI